ncbi:MAG TPA: hypothetical protein VGC79_29520, partial [Polyangiaceae bacterium]
WLVCGTALGQPAAALTLRWEAPAGCPQQAEVRERIRKLTGSMNSAGTALRAEGTITQTDSTHFHLQLVMRSGGLVGQRKLDATSCENLSGAAAVSLALLMRSAEPLSEGDLAGQQPVGTAQTATAQTAGAARTRPSAPAAAAAQPAEEGPERDTSESNARAQDAETRPIGTTERNWRTLAQLPLAAISFGPLPKPSWGVGFAGGVSFENWRFLLGGSAWLRQDVPAETFPGYGAEVERLTGTFKACRALRRAAFEVAPCLVLSLEHVSARGTGAGVTARSEQATWLSLGAGAQGRLYLASWLSLLIGVDAQIETARPVISIAGVGDLAQLGPAAFTATIGPEWIL